MSANTGLHPDQARWQVGKARVDLAARLFLSKHDRTTLIVSHDVERVLANIDADHGDCAVVGLLRHGVLLVFAAPSYLLSLAGREHGRTIPLADIRWTEIWSRRNAQKFHLSLGRMLGYPHDVWRRPLSQNTS